MAKERSKRALQWPKQQLLILAICRFGEPVVMTSVYPYIVSFSKPGISCWRAGDVYGISILAFADLGTKSPIQNSLK